MREKIFEIIEPASEKQTISYLYDSIMMTVIIASIIPLAFKETNTLFDIVDKIAVVVFIIDYLLRFITADYAIKGESKFDFFIYPFTPMAIIDLVSILPSITALNNGFRLLKILRLLRTLRVFRVFKLFRYSKSIERIVNILQKQKAALFAVSILAIGYIFISALVIFNVEPNTFETFFDALYWSTVSLTTIGYGDIYPVTVIGRIITMISSIIGIAIVALPAGIITAGYMTELSNEGE